MNYEAVVKAKGNPEVLYKSFILEKGDFGRSSFDIKKNKDSVDFVVTSQDVIALKATLNSIIKLLTVYEKADVN